MLLLLLVVRQCGAIPLIGSVGVVGCCWQITAVTHCAKNALAATSMVMVKWNAI